MPITEALTDFDMAVLMPIRTNKLAPKFDLTNPRTLEQYVEDLEMLFEQAVIVDDKEKKRYFVTYVAISEQDTFKGLSEFAKGNTYESFVKAVCNLYPGLTKDKKYTAADLTKFVEGRRGKKMSEITEFSKFCREFLAITSYLLTKKKITEAKQSCAIIRGLPDVLWQHILTCLQVIKPNHNLDDKWEFKHIIAACQYVLHGTTTRPLLSMTTADYSTITIKKEELTTMMEGLGKTIVSALTTTLAPQPVRRTTGLSTTNVTTGSATSTISSLLSCYYCQGSHMVTRCEKVLEDLQNGLLKRNKEGCLVLSNGSTLPAF